MADYEGEDLLQQGKLSFATDLLMCLVFIKTPLLLVKGPHFLQYGGRNIIQLNGTLLLRMLYFQQLDNMVFRHGEKLF